MRDMKPRTSEKIFGPQYVTRELTIAGEVLKPVSFTTGELLLMKQTRIEGVTMLCGSGKLKEEIKSYDGVLLRDLLDLAEINLKEHDSPNHIIIVVSGSDGYYALFSWHELFNSPTGDQVLVITRKNDKPLDEDEGEIGLISACDERPGPRHIRYLHRIEVHEV